MSLDKTIRRNLDGEYITIPTNLIEVGVEYAIEIGLNQIQIRNSWGGLEKLDFAPLARMAELLTVLSIIASAEVVNEKALYDLTNLKKIYLHNSPKFKLDISQFPNLVHFGGVYKANFIVLSNAFSLQSLVLTLYSKSNLVELSDLSQLEILHLYRPRIVSLDGLEDLPLKEITLYKASKLLSLDRLLRIATLKTLILEGCPDALLADLDKFREKGINVSVLSNK